MNCMMSKSKNSNRIFCIVIATAMLLAIVASCTSRYKVDLFMSFEESRRKVKIEATEYVQESTLGDPYSDEQVISGKENTLILRIGTRGENLTEGKKSFIRYDEYFRARIFLTLPAIPVVTTLPLKDNSFVQIMGRYEIDAIDKIFIPDSGTFVIDSISGDKLYGTLDGHFKNHSNDLLRYEGQFRAKIKR